MCIQSQDDILVDNLKLYTGCLKKYTKLIRRNLKLIGLINNNQDFCCPDEERFYRFEILAFRTLKL